MPRISICLFLLVFANPVAAHDEVSSAPGLDYIELVPFTYLEELENNAAGSFKREGEGGMLRFGWQTSELLAFTGSYRVTDSEAGIGDERSDKMHELSMGFVAPFTDSTRLLVELGVAGETQRFTVADGQGIEISSSSDVFAAIGFRARFNWFELGLRSAGQTFHDSRHQSHALDMRFHLSEHFALGVHAEAADRDTRDTRRAGLGLQFKF